MKNLRFVSVLLAVVLILSLAVPMALAAPAPELNSARCAVIGDVKTGTILYEYNADEKAEPASITKMMTLLLAAEAVEQGEISLDDKVTAGEDCRFDLTDDSSNSQIFPGERMRFEELLYCAALASANEACNIIASAVGGSIRDFVGRMNEKAAELGCEHTHFANTHGLPDPEHYTTAHDLFLIACEGMRHELFRTLVGTAEHTVPATNNSGERLLNNSNALLTDESPYGDEYAYDGAVGIKTGHTNAAGFCLASAAERDGLLLAAVVLGCEGDMKMGEFFDNFSDSAALLDWAFASFRLVCPVSEGEALGNTSVAYKTRHGNMSLFAEGSAELLIPADTELHEELTLYAEGQVAPKGRVVGELAFCGDDGTVYGRTRVLSGEIEFETPAPEPTPTPAPTQEGLPALWESLDEEQRLVLGIALAVLLIVIVCIAAALIRRRKNK